MNHPDAHPSPSCNSDSTPPPPIQPQGLHQDPSFLFLPNGQCMATTPASLMNHASTALSQAAGYYQCVATSVMKDNLCMLDTNRAMAVKVQAVMAELATERRKGDLALVKVAETVKKAVESVEHGGFAGSVSGVAQLRQLLVDLGQGGALTEEQARQQKWVEKDEQLRSATGREEARLARQADALRIAGLEAELAAERAKVEAPVAGETVLVEKLAAQQENVEKLIARDRDLQAVRAAMREELDVKDADMLAVRDELAAKTAELQVVCDGRASLEDKLRVAKAESATLSRRIDQMRAGDRGVVDESVRAARDAERLAKDCAAAATQRLNDVLNDARLAHENERAAKRDVLAAKGEVAVVKQELRRAVEKAAKNTRASAEAMETMRRELAVTAPTGPDMVERVEPLLETVAEMQVAMRAMSQGYAVKLAMVERAAVGLREQYVAREAEWKAHLQCHDVHVKSLRQDLTCVSEDVSNMAETLRDIVLHMDQKIHVIGIERNSLVKQLTDEVAGLTAVHIVLESRNQELQAKVEDAKTRSVERVKQAKAKCQERYQAEMETVFIQKSNEIRELDTRLRWEQQHTKDVTGFLEQERARVKDLTRSVAELTVFHDKIRALIPVGVRPDDGGAHMVVQEALRMALSSAVPASSAAHSATAVVVERVGPAMTSAIVGDRATQSLSDVDDALITEMITQSSGGATCSSLVVSAIKKTLHRFESVGVLSFGSDNEVLLNGDVDGVDRATVCVVLRALVTALNTALQYGLNIGDMSDKLTVLVHEVVDIRLSALLALMDTKSKQKKDPKLMATVQAVRKFGITYERDLANMQARLVNQRLGDTKAACAMSVFRAAVGPTFDLE